MSDKPPIPIVEKTARGLTPVTAYDAEEIDEYAIGSKFDLVCRTKRSSPQLRAYWKTLGMVVSSTGRWPSRESLHDSLKFACGRISQVYDMNGNATGFQASSISMAKMPHKEFCKYMDEAMAKLSEAVGYDVLWWYDEPP